MNVIEVHLKEYVSLREEALASISNRAQIMSFGLGTIGVLYAGVLIGDSTEMTLFKMIILVFGIPFTSLAVLYIWLGELHRMMRAGNYLVLLEKKINSILQTQALGWENFLRDSGKQMNYPYLITIGLFLGIMISSPVIAYFIAPANLRTYSIWLLIPIVAAAFSFVQILFWGSGIRKVNKFHPVLKSKA